MLRVAVIVLIVYGGLLGMTWWSYQQLPRGFVPTQDMGYLLLSACSFPIRPPPSGRSTRSRRSRKICLTTPGIKTTSGVAGQSFFLNATGSNFGSMFVILEDFDDRRGDPERASDKVARQAAAALQRGDPGRHYRRLRAAAHPRRRPGRRFQDHGRGPRRESPPNELQAQVDNLVDQGNKTAGLVGLSSIYRANVPQLYIDIDRKECLTRGVALKDVFDTLADLPGLVLRQRLQPLRPHLAGHRAGRVALSRSARRRASLAGRQRTRGRWCRSARSRPCVRSNGPLILTRYNMYPAAAINGGTAEGVQLRRRASSLMESLANAELPQEHGRRMDRDGVPGAALRQHGDVDLRARRGDGVSGAGRPVRELVDAPGGHSGGADVHPSALAGVAIAGHDINIFTQIGFVVLVGPGEQERHPDRRVREEEPRGGRERGARRRCRPASCVCGRSS